MHTVASRRISSNGLSVSRTDGCKSMMMSVLDDLRPEPRPTMLQTFDIEGIARKEFVPPGQTVNGTFYCDVLRRTRVNIRRQPVGKWRNDSWAPNHDNAPAHTSLVLQQYLASTNRTVIRHPPYSPDLATCGFFLYPKMKLKLKGRRFDSIDEIQTESQDVMEMLKQNNF